MLQKKFSEKRKQMMIPVVLYYDRLLKKPVHIGGYMITQGKGGIQTGTTVSEGNDEQS